MSGAFATVAVMSLALRQPNRLFVALDLPDDLRDALAGIADAVATRYGGRAVPRDNLHGTIAFLGDVDPVRAPALEEALDEAAGPPLRVRLGSLVARPSAGRARLVAVELEDVSGDLAERWGRIARAFAVAAGIPADERVWPHVTLARFRRPARVDVRGEWYRSNERMFDIRTVTLYDSHRTHRGPPRYEAVAAVALSDVTPPRPAATPTSGPSG
jgi:2'-5' RNA ligase